MAIPVRPYGSSVIFPKGTVAECIDSLICLRLLNGVAPHTLPFRNILIYILFFSFCLKYFEHNCVLPERSGQNKIPNGERFCSFWFLLQTRGEIGHLRPQCYFIMCCFGLIPTAGPLSSKSKRRKSKNLKIYRSNNFTTYRVPEGGGCKISSMSYVCRQELSFFPLAHDHHGCAAYNGKNMFPEYFLPQPANINFKIN